MTWNNLTKKTLVKVTMSMMTTMTAVLHRDLETDWSSFPFSTVLVACIQGVYGVAASFLIGLHDRVFSVVTPSFRSSCVILSYRCCSVKCIH